MSYEVVKSFILAVLVAISLLLSFILWSYQPNYEYLYDTKYVNEVDIGGEERNKNELIRPSKINFKQNKSIYGFVDMVEQHDLFQTITTWELDDMKVRQVDGRPSENEYVEMTFPPQTPVELLGDIFTFDDVPSLPDWTFTKVFIVPDDEMSTLTVQILSDQQNEMIEFSVEKSGAYDFIDSYVENKDDLIPYYAFDVGDDLVYLPSDEADLKEKTFVASTIQPDLFINALFSNPNLVTQNVKEAYFTDGQRGMRIVQDGRLLQFINPLQEKYEESTSEELFEQSVMNVNEHKGWTNNYYLESIQPEMSKIRYRLHYVGYPVYNFGNLSIIEQSWREQDLHEYNRPLFKLGNLLNERTVDVMSGEEVINYIQSDEEMDENLIEDIQLGYMMTVLEDEHSVTLTPQWAIHYDGDWIRFNPKEMDNRGGDQ